MSTDNHGILKARKTNELYMYHSEGRLTNLSTGKKGKLDESQFPSLFDIPISLNNMVAKNPLVVDLICMLGLKVEPLTDDEKWERINNFMTNENK